ncbi:transposase [Chloroflexi bacterium TSY]|nr:transposase [Chloroflexi bacterium TSY]
MPYSPYFSHVAQREHAYHYMRGLLDPEIKRKSAENIALATVGESVYALQSFVGQSRWSGEAMLAEHTRQTGELLGDANGVLLLDGSDIPKQGEESVGVKRQRCGELGKIANCQAGVFLGYNSSHGYTLLNCRLYIPQEWFSDEYAEKRYKTGLPTDLTFQTKNELAWSMIEQTHALVRCPSAGSLWMKPLAKILICLTALMAKPLTATLLKCPKRLVSGPPAPRPICPHHLDAGASSSSASGLVNLRLSPLLNSLTPSRSMSGNSMFSKRAPRASSLLPLLVAALSLSAMGSRFCSLAHRPPQSRLLSAILSPMHPLRLPWMTSPLFLLCVGPLKPFLNKPSSFSDSTNMKLAVGSVGIII